jgi:hypothetical protein
MTGAVVVVAGDQLGEPVTSGRAASACDRIAPRGPGPVLTLIIAVL